jgi:hypothetical protein
LRLSAVGCHLKALKAVPFEMVSDGVERGRRGDPPLAPLKRKQS